MTISKEVHNGVPEANTAAAQHLAELEQAYAQQQERAEWLAALFDRAAIGLVTATPDGYLIQSNRAFQDILGYSAQELQGMDFRFFTHPDDLHLETTLLSELLSGQRSIYQVNKRYIHKNGSIVWVSVGISLLSNQQGETLGLIASVENITEQREIQMTLRDSEERIRLVLEATNDGIWDWNIPAGKVYYSPRWGEMLGYTEDELAPDLSTWESLLHPDDIERAKAVVASHMQLQSSSYEIEFRMWMKDGGWKWILARGNVVAWDEQGNAVRMMGTHTDIDERKREEHEREALQQQVIEAQRAALREMSTPLIPLSDHVVLMPLIGSIDTQRAGQIMESLLEGVAHYRADIAIVDITGVMVMDTQVANALIQAAQAIRLLGARVMLTGIGPAMAQTLVSLGADLQGIETRGTLQQGIASALF
jgi:rsbT co-antagonist protein RsbR